MQDAAAAIAETLPNQEAVVGNLENGFEDFQVQKISKRRKQESKIPQLTITVRSSSKVTYKTEFNTKALKLLNVDDSENFVGLYEGKENCWIQNDRLFVSGIPIHGKHTQTIDFARKILEFFSISTTDPGTYMFTIEDESVQNDVAGVKLEFHKLRKI